MFCYKCGNKLSDNDKYCLKCGARTFKPEEIELLLSKTDEIAEKSDNVKSDEVKGKAVSVPKKNKTKAESFMQFMTILFIVFALVIITIVGSMVISGRSDKAEGDEVNTSSTSDSVSSQADSAVSSEDESSETTTTATKKKDGLTVLDKAEMKKKIVGTWKTSIVHKSMSVPGTIVFKSNGTCSVSVSALFISKKFEGTYTVGNNGKCVMNLPGLEEFIENKNTISGTASFYNDNKVKFVTDGGNVLTLTRA